MYDRCAALKRHGEDGIIGHTFYVCLEVRFIGKTRIYFGYILKACILQ